MDLEELHFADDSGDDPYEIVLLPDNTNRIAPENRLSPAHACISLPLKGNFLLIKNVYQMEFISTYIKIEHLCYLF